MSTPSNPLPESGARPFEGKTVLLTGAGSPRGVGRALLTQFQAGGAQVIGVDADAQRLEAARGWSTPGTVFVTADITTSEGAAAAVDAAGNQLDIVCNNAAALDMALLDETELQSWLRVLAVNLTASFLISKYALPVMLKQKHGVIINTGSIAGIRGGRAGPGYTASKFGVVGLTQNIAATYGSAGLRCNAILPGAIDSGFPDSVPVTTRMQEFQQKFEGEIPTKARPDQIASAVLLLASDAASYINGAVLTVDAGLTAR